MHQSPTTPSKPDYAATLDLQVAHCFAMAKYYPTMRGIALAKFLGSETDRGDFAFCPRDVLCCDGMPRIYLSVEDLTANGVPFDRPIEHVIFDGGSADPRPGCPVYQECLNRNRDLRRTRAMKELEIGPEFFAVHPDRMQRHIRLAVETYLTQREDLIAAGIGLVLQGSYGCGKTGALMYLAAELRCRGYFVLVSTMERVVNHLIREGEDAAEYRAQVLVIEEFEKGWSASEFPLEKVLGLVNERYKRRLPILCDSNTPLADVAKNDDRWAPLVSRWTQVESGDRQRMMWVKQPGTKDMRRDARWD